LIQAIIAEYKGYYQLRRKRCVEGRALAITERHHNQGINEDVARKKLAEWERFSSQGFAKLAPTGPLIAAAAELSISPNYPLTHCSFLALAIERKAPLATTDPRLPRSPVELPATSTCFATFPCDD